MTPTETLTETALVAEMQRLVDGSLPLRRRLRREAFAGARYGGLTGCDGRRGYYASLPVRIVPGEREPYYAGEGWRYTTRTGIPIRHPSAYSRVGWSSMEYCPSTRRVEVGARYVERLLAEGADEAV
jgi:hypothetical protein